VVALVALWLEPREGILLGAVTDLDVCASDRFTLRTEQATLWHTHRSLSSLVFSTAVWSLLVFLALLVTLGESKTNTSDARVNTEQLQARRPLD
jgi:hypothetical protein